MIFSTIICVLLFAAFVTGLYVLARARADHGLMDQMPALKIPVAIMPIPAPGIESAMTVAKNWWNRQLNVSVIVFSDVPTFDTCVFVEEVWAEDFFARATFVPEHLSVLLLVNMRERDRFPSLLPRALCHELGHVLGLADDDDPQSVMYRRVTTGAFILTSKDRALVEGRI